jgi:aryl-alcohol dehydrogenase-like predicted oxidoreductase
MKYFEWGKENQKVSTLCLGTMLMGSVMSKEESFLALDDFVSRGGNFIDTANNYAWWTGTGQNTGEESETLLGEWFKSRGSRDKIILVSKVGAGIDPKTVLRNPDGTVDWNRYDPWKNYQGLGKDTIPKAVDSSLKRLKTDYLDICLAHIDCRSIPLEETLAAFDLLARQGKIRHVGASNMQTWRLEEARQISRQNGWAPYEVIQNEYSYLRPRQNADFGNFNHTGPDLMDYLKARPEVLNMAYSPLLKGILLNNANRESVYLWKQFDSNDTRQRLETLSRIARETGSNENRIALAWMMARTEPRIVPVLGFSRLEQYMDNIQSMEVELTSGQIKELDSAGE